jgi:hypothetical protein
MVCWANHCRALDKPKRQKFKRYPIGYFHIDIAEVRTAEGKLHLLVAIDRTSKFAVTRLLEKANRKTAWEFLEEVLAAVPYKIHTILTPSHGLQAIHCRAVPNGIQFAEQPRNRNTITSRPMHFDMICDANGIEHRLTKPNHPPLSDCKQSPAGQRMDQWPGQTDEPNDQ